MPPFGAFFMSNGYEIKYAFFPLRENVIFDIIVTSSVVIDDGVSRPVHSVRNDETWRTRCAFLFIMAKILLTQNGQEGCEYVE